MKHAILFGVAVCVGLLAHPVPAQQRAAIGNRADAEAVRTLSYGPDKLQKLDFYAAKGRARAPLVVFVHGGGWKRGDKNMMRGSDKLKDWQAKGFAVASLNYRLVPDARVEDQAADVAAAVALLKRQAPVLAFDADRIVLVGHSAGAHLVALVGTDPQWLGGVGLPMTAVRGIVPLDGAGYHVPSQVGKNEAVLGDTYVQAFGTDPARQKALSPTLHAQGPNAPAFLILYVQRADAKAQSEGLAKALRAGGTLVETRQIAGRGLKGHMEINRRLGEAAYPATAIVDGWLSRLFAR